MKILCGNNFFYLHGGSGGVCPAVTDNLIDRFISPRRFLGDKFVEMGWKANRGEHIPNFLDLLKFRLT